MSAAWDEDCKYGLPQHDFEPTRVPAPSHDLGPIVAVCRKCGALR